MSMLIFLIFFREEYMEYQQRIRNGGNVQIDSTSLPRIKNSNAYSKSYFGPDDDYWYEQNKKNK